MRLRTWVAWALLAAAVAFALCFGAYRGWSGEKAQVEETYAGLNAVLTARAEAACNILTVAKRHLSETDEALQAVDACRRTLQAENESLSRKAESSARLTESADALLAKLAALPSVQQDSRDKMYVESYLPQMLKESEEITAGALYNQAAAQYNHDLRAEFSGRLAMLLGVGTAEEFAQP